MSTARPRTLYVFLDESGDFAFTDKGSDHFVLSAVYTDDPCPSAAAMQEVKYRLIAEGSEDLDFHATENKQATRDRVTETIRTMTTIRVHTLWIDKHCAHPSKHDEVELLSLFGMAMGQWICAVASSDRVDQIVMIFDNCLPRRSRSAFNAAIKPRLKTLSITFRVLFHPVKSDMNGQIADYFSWAWFRYIERGDDRAVVSLGEQVHWSKSNLLETSRKSAGKNDHPAYL